MATNFGFMPTKSGSFYFISYNTEDSLRVAPIVRYMNQCGVPFWYDYGLEYGKEWETQIATHIADCEAVLMFVTNGLFHKEKSYVRKEYDEAVIYGKKIIPVFLDNIKPSALPRHSVGFYIDLNRLHNVPYAKSNSEQDIAKRSANSLGITLSENINSPERKTEPKPINVEKSKTHTLIKRLLIAAICTVVALAVIGSLISFTMQGYFISRNVVQDGIRYKISYGNASITDYNGNASVLEIPSKMNGAKVIAIDKEAFFDCDNFTEVIIPNNVTIIDYMAFYHCGSLTEITIPNSVTIIGDSAFSQCTKLTKIFIPDSVISIGKNAFSCCYNLTKITIPNSVTNIGNYAFAYCDSLTEITIPDSVTSIGYDAFSNCTITVYAPHDALYYGCTPAEGVTWVIIE